MREVPGSIPGQAPKFCYDTLETKKIAQSDISKGCFDDWRVRAYSQNLQ